MSFHVTYLNFSSVPAQPLCQEWVEIRRRIDGTLLKKKKKKKKASLFFTCCSAGQCRWIITVSVVLDGGIWSRHPPPSWTKPNMSGGRWQIEHLLMYRSCDSWCRAAGGRRSALCWIVKEVLNRSVVLFDSKRTAHLCFIVSSLQVDVLLS